MMGLKQRTISQEVVFSGIGLHAGEPGRVTLSPAPVGSGLVVANADGQERLRPGIVDGQGHCTSATIKYKSKIATLEHLLAAVWGLGIDNLRITAEGSEVPGLDGSAGEFTGQILAAGLEEQAAEQSVFIPKQSLAVGSASAGLTAYPAADGNLTLTYLLDYPDSPLARGNFTFTLTDGAFQADLAPARTFATRAQAEAMLSAGFGKGANPQNTIILDGNQVVDNQLRFPDECVRHKLVDLLGDLAVLNRRLGVHVVAVKSGHRLNLELTRRLEEEISRVEHPKGLMDIREIMQLLPHRYPFLLVDRVIALEPKRSITALKNLTGNEHFFQGHFPGQPIMPGVLQIEALAQAGAIMMLGEYRDQNKLAVLMTAEEVKWRRQVVPGDCMHLHAEAVKMKGRIGIVRTWATVEGENTVEAIIKFAMIDAGQSL
jgi:UDP-3-O-[3-hydroxymyristoyl] N-acetylglucosamine deacetylase/3-hydroxyacyl-[acyl-carrier-protein] dehydratase